MNRDPSVTCAYLFRLHHSEHTAKLRMFTNTDHHPLQHKSNTKIHLCIISPSLLNLKVPSINFKNASPMTIVRPQNLEIPPPPTPSQLPTPDHSHTPFLSHAQRTLPWPLQTKVPMNATFFSCEMSFRTTDCGCVCLREGRVSPVKLDSSISRSTAYK